MAEEAAGPSPSLRSGEWENVGSNANALFQSRYGDYYLDLEALEGEKAKESRFTEGWPFYHRCSEGSRSVAGSGVGENIPREGLIIGTIASADR